MRPFVVAVIVLASAPAFAEPSPQPFLTQKKVETPPVAWSVAAGLATGLLSMAIGGALAASDDHGRQQAGTYVMMTGLALAPAVSHLVSKEWGRSAIFGALPTAALLGMVGLLEAHPQVTYEGNKDPHRTGYVVLIAVSIVSSAGGIVDSMWAGERARKRQLTFAPMISRDRYGLALGGSW